jgi:iron complex transport system permease protein
MTRSSDRFRAAEYAAFTLVTLAVLLLCICVGSVTVRLTDTLTVLWNTVFNLPVPAGMSQSIILFVRLPRVLCVALVGASLSLCGAAMQGLLRNPLADGSTLGVSSGASLGAVTAIAFGISIPGFALAGPMVMAMLFAFLSLVLILALTYRLDASLSTHTIILMGVIFTMFAHSIMSVIIAFSGEKIKSIVFWTMGSLAGSNLSGALTLLVALVVCGTVIFRYTRELNAFSISEDNARHVGVPVKKVKLSILIAVSALIGVCVSIGGTIGFVGLVMPHMTRMIVGPNHKQLLPASLFSGAIFLMLADLTGRILLSPLELPIGVVTSFIGSIVFVFIFYASRKTK